MKTKEKGEGEGGRGGAKEESQLKVEWMGD